MNNNVEDISESGASATCIISEDITHRRGEDDSLTTSNYSSSRLPPKVSHLLVYAFHSWES